jgi:hypothetical protein
MKQKNSCKIKDQKKENLEGRRGAEQHHKLMALFVSL